jgi:diguanylate cyclase (GGDEF)-like protein/PAS domain S-box-containing protein
MLGNENGFNILYVEGDIKTRREISSFLKQFSNRLYDAADAQTALQLYKQKSIDLLICAIMLPGKKNGIELVQEIKEKNPYQLVIFLSAYSDKKYLLDAINMQVEGYLLKPVNYSDLESKIIKLKRIKENEIAAKKLKESEEKFRKIADNTEIGIFIYQKNYIYVNDAFCKMTEYTKEELYKKEPWEILDKQYINEVKKIVTKRLKGEEFSREYTDLIFITKNGTKKIARANTATIELDGKYAGMGTMVDITDIIEIQEELSIFKQAIEQMDEMVKITSIHGDIVFVNSAVIKNTGYTLEELIGAKNSIFKSGKNNQQCYKELWQTIQQKEIYHNTFINKKKNGELYYEEQTITPILDSKTKEIKYFVTTSKDITKEIKMLKKLEALATKDTLTQIHNRYSMNIIIDEQIAHAKRYDNSFVLMMFDIDHFKRVNDTYGHDIGDIILKELTQLIIKAIRESDQFGRWGGEEFMLLATSTPLEDGINIAEKLRKKVETFNFTKVDKITISIGLTEYKKGESKNSLLKRVDDALYDSKHLGRNRVSFR